MVATQSPLKRKRSLDNGTVSTPPRKRLAVTLQIITGSYERVLNGFTATVPAADDEHQEVAFSDQFLFNAHASSIRCLAISPSSDADVEQQPPKRILATGGADERINLYSLSASVPPASNATKGASILPISATADNSSRNRELGSLMHHSSTITRLHFVSRGKLLSASLDNTIAIARAKDWTVLSTIRAPIPKAAGRPSGDTAAPGEVPAGINDVAVHPSAKLCLSVGQGERCMRLWNLVTGKKAGVLTFEKPVLSLLGEGRWRGGEGRSVVWCNDGEEFTVGFEKGAVVYGLDCQVRAVVKIDGSKICRVMYVPQIGMSRNDTSNGTQTDGVDQRLPNVLAISTEDGRILFFHTNETNGQVNEETEADTESLLLHPVCQLGSMSRGNRIKDFQIFHHPDFRDRLESIEGSGAILVVAGSSDGAVSIWNIQVSELMALIKETKSSRSQTTENSTTESQQRKQEAKRVGILLGTYKTGRRITCLAGFLMHATRATEEIKTSPGEDEEEWAGFDATVESTDINNGSGD